MKNWLKSITHHHQINMLDITLFLRQFATLIAAGVPIIQSCNILEKTQEKIAFRRLIFTIKQELLTGKSLFISLQRHANYFDKFTCQLVKIGEHTGKLDTMLLIIAQHQEKNLAFVKRIKQALFYPSIITITALIVTVSLLLFVIPRFAELFQDTKEKLPLLTLFIFYLSATLKKYFFLITIVIFLFIFILIKNKKSTSIKQLLSTLPFIKPCLKKINLARFTRNLAITFTAGLPIIEALKLSANMSSDTEFISIMTKLISKISTGLQLHSAMEEFSYFPTLMTQMIKVGEESGKLEPMLNKVADFLESDIEQQISRFNQLLEPLIMLVLGVLIGGLVIGMYLPLFKLGTRL